MKLPPAHATQHPLLTDDDASFVPPNGIIVPVPPLSAELRELVRQHALATDPTAAPVANDASQEEFKFGAFTASFVKLQAATTKAMSLPIITSDFTNKYGSFSKQTEVTNCVEALKSLNTLCAKFGNPALLSKEIQALATGEKPTQLYGQIVWLAQLIADKADTFHLTLKALQESLTDAQTPAKRKEILVGLLTGKGGLVSEALEMETEATTLRNALLAYKDELLVVKKPINTYSSPQSAIYAEAVAKNADLALKVKATQAQLEAARKEYIDYVIAASSVSVGVFVLSMGMLWPVSAVAGGVLGHLAEEARKHANALEAELATQSIQAQQKADLVKDIGALDIELAPLETHLQAVCEGLGKIAGTWARVAYTLGQLAKNTSPDALMDLEALMIHTKIMVGQEKWKLTQKLTSDFIINAFVQVD